MQRYDVVIVGFGPSGAVAANLFGQAGLRTLAIDRARTVYDKPRAIALDHEIMRVFQQIGVADAVTPHIAPFPASVHFGADGEPIRKIDAVPPPFPLGYTPTLVFSQPPVEAILRAKAAAHERVEIALGVELAAFDQDETGVTLDLRDDNGGTRRVIADHLIGCDGASSTVRRQAGLALEDLGFDEPWLVVDVMATEAGVEKLPREAAQHCDPARPTTYIVGPGRHRRWEIMLSPGEDPREMEREPQVWALLAPWVTPADATLWRAASYRFHALVAREWRRGRVFIAGDAAHQQPPFIGQGMCQGVRDVVNLAWKLEAVRGGHAADALLDTYGAERGRHVRDLTGRIMAIGRVICERNPQAARARDAKLRAEGGGRARTITRQEIVPPLATGLIAADGEPANGPTAAGTLFPQPRVGKADTTAEDDVLADAITGTGWRLYLDGRNVGDSAAAGIPHDVAGGALATVLICAPDAAPGHAPPPAPVFTHTLVERDGVMAAWFDRHGCAAALVRPDHYVYGVAPSLEAAAILVDSAAARFRHGGPKASS